MTQICVPAIYAPPRPMLLPDPEGFLSIEPPVPVVFAHPRSSHAQTDRSRDDEGGWGLAGKRAYPCLECGATTSISGPLRIDSPGPRNWWLRLPRSKLNSPVSSRLPRRKYGVLPIKLSPAQGTEKRRCVSPGNTISTRCKNSVDIAR